jgi:hypothetical protein
MKIKWYWVVYLIAMTVSFIKWSNSIVGLLLVFSVIALVILLITKETGNTVIYNVYTDDDDDFEKPIENENKNTPL